ncbi:glucose/arabinose dehydrogenase [Saccharothrix saharensis]|uniref:Glucose/arabinose dehydrogenase n=1 Tax=Saccharothrix saharensis TaxID=571190 RepID=A0A543JPC6_9PSEU|nr:PQQ-dependent sugar dehydrogenase [Saccharothrix saharensis]TQM84676.1 glucose/arabinose dehydrogenase [Saccharothrix saharensis]
MAQHATGPRVGRRRSAVAAVTAATALSLLTASGSAQGRTEHQAEDATVSGGVVASAHGGFTGSGYVDYADAAGGYVEYEVTAARSGTHTLVFRYANATGADLPVDLTVDGRRAGAVGFPATGAWTTWRDVTAAVALEAGVNRVRATAATDRGGPDTDRLLVDDTDVEPPTPPRRLRATGTSDTTVSLAWEPATDDVGVVGYDVYQHGQLMTSVPGTESAATVTGLRPDTAYDWTVLARDAASNVSRAGNNVVVRTDASPADDEAPTAPANPRVVDWSATSVSLAWDASTDDMGVTGYEVHRAGAPVVTTDGTSTAITGLTAGTGYRFAVRARDAAGNVSAFSDEVHAVPEDKATAGAPRPGEVTTLREGTDVPWGLAFLPDGSALVSERERFTLYRLAPDGTWTALGRVPGAQATNGEGGVLGVAVSPLFAYDNTVFIYHTAAAGNQVVRVRLVGDMLTGWHTILGGIPKNRYHNGGGLQFSPDGGYLFVSTGDAQNGSYGQNLDTNAGKILRIHPDGSIPEDNPFPGKAIWSYGHRNVQGMAFDSQGRLWATEFGNNSLDEVNLIQRGGNYGWPGCEGTAGYCEGSIPPKTMWPTSAGGPSGLAIVDDHLFIGTTVGQRLYRLRIDGSDLVEQEVFFQGRYGRLRTLRLDREGDLWLTTTWDLDEEVGNDRVLHVDLVYPGS